MPKILLKYNLWAWNLILTKLHLGGLIISRIGMLNLLGKVDISTYEIDTYVIQTFLPGDKITITTNDTSPIGGTIIVVNSNFTFRIKCSDNLDISSPNLYYKIQKDLLKIDSSWSDSKVRTSFSTFNGYQLEGGGAGLSTVYGLTLAQTLNDYSANVQKCLFKV